MGIGEMPQIVTEGGDEKSPDPFERCEIEPSPLGQRQDEPSCYVVYAQAVRPTAMSGSDRKSVV